MAAGKDVTTSGRKDPSTTPARRVHGHATDTRAGAVVAALGVVFGDIGTSPLYTFKTVLGLAGGRADPDVVLGILSLMIWTLIIVATIKYVAIAMSIDNDGEGGILALKALVSSRRGRPIIAAVGLFGAALIYGDGAVTPAISVLSALEGLTMATPAVEPYVLPGAVAILIALFAAQPLGTERIGKAFGPVMTLWFVAIAILGAAAVARHPGILRAIDPLHAVRYLATGGVTGYLVLGGVFLCVTGAEALYADMGHFGPRPIRLGWIGLVLPSLVLNYAGQAALVLDGAPAAGNIFFRLCPGPVLIPMVVLSTLATIIASQSIITGAFSMTRQAIQLGWLPRVAIKQTSAEGYGQIYVGTVNWLLMGTTVALALLFQKSDNLASAYGIAVSLTMALTTILLFFALHEVNGWPPPVAAAVAALFGVVDLAFFGANAVKIAEGGYVPLLIAAAIYAVMWIWHRGADALNRRLTEASMPLDDFKAKALEAAVVRVPGTGVFLTRSGSDTPPVLIWHLKHNKALHEKVLVLTVGVSAAPFVAEGERLTIAEIGDDVWRAEASFGFMDDLDIPSLLEAARQRGCGADLEDVTFYVGHAVIVARRDGTGLPRWMEMLYAAMERNALHIGDVLNLPRDQTVELGRQIAI